METDTTDILHLNFDKFSGSVMCKCFSFVLQCVLVGSLGSFLFGCNVSNLNMAISAINSEYLQCGVADVQYEPYWSFDPSQCAADPICATSCGVKDDVDNRQLITKVRCPGGYNDVTCNSLKWFNAITVCAVLIGGAFGSAVGGRLLYFGCRSVLLIMLTVFTFGIISSVCANSFSALVWARIVVGLAVGLSSVVPPTYMSEMTPAKKRGTYGVFHQLSIVTAQFIAMLIGLPLVNPSDQNDRWEPNAFQKFWWRFMLGVPLIPVVIALYLLLNVYTFETPLYYVGKRRFGDAEALLKMIHGKDDVQLELLSAVDYIHQSQKSKASGMTFWKAFSNSKYRHVILVGIAIAGFQQFGGINVFMTSSSDLFRKAGLNGEMQKWMSILMAGLLLICTFPAMYLIDRIGRRTLLLFGSSAQFLFIMPAAIFYWLEPDPDNPSNVTKYLALIAVTGFVVSFAFAFGPVIWVYIFEIFPLEIKDVAAGVAASFNWISGIIMVFAAIILPNQISFTIFGVLQFLATLFIFFFIKETRGYPIGKSPYIADNESS